MSHYFKHTSATHYAGSPVTTLSSQRSRHTCAPRPGLLKPLSGPRSPSQPSSAPLSTSPVIRDAVFTPFTVQQLGVGEAVLCRSTSASMARHRPTPAPLRYHCSVARAPVRCFVRPSSPIREVPAGAAAAESGPSGGAAVTARRLLDGQRAAKAMERGG